MADIRAPRPTQPASKQPATAHIGALARTLHTNADWQFWLFSGLWAVTVALAWFCGTAFLGWVEDTFLSPFGLLRSPKSTSLPTGSFLDLCFAGLTFLLCLVGIWNLIDLRLKRQERFIPLLPSYLNSWLLGLAPLAVAYLIATTIFT